MKKQISPTALVIIATSFLAILFLTGASKQSENNRWSISAVSGPLNGLYIMDQSNGDIYFLDDDPNISRSHAKIEKLGNISDAR